MRITHLICSFALLAIAGASSASAGSVDANRMAIAKQLEADLQEQTLLLNTWFADKWNYEHPGQGAKQIDHYAEILKVMVDDPTGTGETLKACIARANADPRFAGFVTAFRKNPPKSRY